MTPLESWLFLAAALPLGVAALLAYCRALRRYYDRVERMIERDLEARHEPPRD